MQKLPQPDKEDGDGPGSGEGQGGKGVPSGGSRGSADDTARRRGSAPNDDAARRRELIRWAGLSAEVVTSVGLSVFLGVKADKWLKLSFPVFSLSLPLLVIVALLINLIKAGTNKKNGK